MTIDLSRPIAEILTGLDARVTAASQPTLTLTGPLAFVVGAASGTLVANIGNVPGEVAPALTPNDGRLVIAGDASTGWKVVVGLTASAEGEIALSVSAAGANPKSATVTVSAAPAATYLPAVSATPLAVAGDRKMVEGYAGPAVRVRRSSDNAEQDIGWDGQSIDDAAASAFVGSAAALVVTIYDQSGAGMHWTVGPGADPARLRITGGAARIVSGATYGNNRNVSYACAALAGDRRNFTIAKVGAVFNHRDSMGLWGFSDGSSGPALTHSHGKVGLGAIAADSNIQPSPDNGTMAASAGQTVMLMTSTASGLTFTRDAFEATNGTSMASAPLGAGYWGREDYGFNATISFGAMIVYNGALPQADRASLVSALRAIHATAAAAPSFNIAFQGDSIIYGELADYNGTVPARVADSLAGRAVVKNFGKRGEPLAKALTDSSLFTDAKWVVANVLNVAVISQSTNDFAGVNVAPQTAAQVWANHQTAVSNLRAKGYTKIIGVTCAKRQLDGSWTSAMEAERVSFNDMVKANSGGLFDAIADFDGIAQSGSAGAPSPTYYPDGLHPNEAGYAIQAPVMMAALNVVGVS